MAYTSEHTGPAIDLAVRNANRILSSGETDPSVSTIGTLGQLYKNTLTGALFRCTGVNGSAYTWQSLEESLAVQNAVRHKFYSVLFFYDNYVSNSFEETVRRFQKYEIVVYGHNETQQGVLTHLHDIGSPVKFYLYTNIGYAADTVAVKNDMMKFAHIGGEVVSTDENGVETRSGGFSVHGVFIDTAGYDYNVTRATQREIIDYARSLGLAIIINAFRYEDLFSSDSTRTMGNGQLANSDGLPSNLNSDDFFLFESNYVRCDEPTQTTYIRSLWSQRRPWEYYNSEYYTTYGTKALTFDNVLTTMDDETAKKIMTFCMFSALIMGCHGSVVVTDAPSFDYLDNVYPDLIHTLSKDDGWVTTRNGGVFSARIGAYNLVSSNLNQNENDEILLTQERLENLSININGTRMDNAWLTPQEVAAQIGGISVVYNNDSDDNLTCTPTGVVGALDKAARADHRHPAGKYLRLREDAWVQKAPEYTNLFGEIGAWHTDQATLTSSERYDASGSINDVWGAIYYSDFADFSVFAGKTIEFGALTFSAGDVASTKFELIVNNVVVSSLYPTADGTSLIGKDTAICDTYTFPNDFNSPVRIRLTSFSGTDRSFSFTGIYASDIDEMREVRTYTQMLPLQLSQYSNYNEAWVADKTLTFNKDGTQDLYLRWSEHTAWSAMVFYYSPAELAGRTVEMGFSTLDQSVSNMIKCYLNAYDSSTSSYVDLIEFSQGTVPRESQIYGDMRLCGTFTFPETPYVDVRILLITPYSTEAIFDAKGMYLYDVDEEVVIYPEEDLYSPTCLEFRCVMQEDLPETLSPSTVYITELGGIYMADKDGNRVALGLTPALSLPENKSLLPVGFQYFSETLGKPVWWNGTGFVDAAGQSVTP